MLIDAMLKFMNYGRLNLVGRAIKEIERNERITGFEKLGHSGRVVAPAAFGVHGDSNVCEQLCSTQGHEGGVRRQSENTSPPIIGCAHFLED